MRLENSKLKASFKPHTNWKIILGYEK